MTRTIQNAHGQFTYVLTLCLSDQVKVLFDGQAKIYELCGFGPGHQFFHVEHGGGVEHRTTVCHRDDGECVVHAQCGQTSSVDGIYRNIEIGADTIANNFAVE